MSNLKKYCMYTAIYGIGFMFCSGAIMQTFLLQAGLSEHQVYLLTSLMQAAQVAMMCVMTFLSGKIKRVKQVAGIARLSLAILAAVFLIGAANPDIVKKPYVVAVFITAGICYLGVGLYNILDYCLPYYIIDMKDYGRMAAIGVALSGGCTFALSFLHTFIVAKFNYMQAMAWFFVLAIACFATTSLMCLSMKEIHKREEGKKTTKEDMIAVFKNRDTYVLLIPNFVRGLTMGIMNVIAVIGISKGILNEQTSSYINIVNCVAMLLGNVCFVITCKRVSTSTYLLIASVAVGGFLVFCLNGGLVQFLALFFFSCLFRYIADTAIPVAITEIIPEKQIGAYTSIRMLLFTAGQAAAPLMITPMIGAIGYTGLMIFAALMQLICCGTYYAVAVKEKRKRIFVEK